MRLLDFFNLPNSSSHTVALGSTQPVTEMSTRNLSGGKGQLANKTDNLTVACEPTVYKMWEPSQRHIYKSLQSVTPNITAFQIVAVITVMLLECLE
jgi:hypothetical protein